MLVPSATGADVLELSHVSKTFRQRGKAIPALVDVDLELGSGETLGIVGESGSGKTTLAKTMLGIETLDLGGTVSLDGNALNAATADRSSSDKRSMQMVFQNPDSALNRSWSVRRILTRCVTKLTGVKGALEAATEAGDLQTEARVRASYVHALLQWVGTEAAAVEIPKLRQIAVHAGDGPSVIALHTLVAEISARKGLVKSALASIEISQDLLSRFENAWQRGRLSIVSAGVSLLQADYDSALEKNEVALRCADRSGSREIRIPALGNLAFIKLAQHKLGDVRTYLLELTDELARGGVSIAEIGIRDIEMQLAIAANDASSASEAEGRLSRLISATEGRDSYYGLWQLLTRVKWLYRLGKASEGVAIALDAIPRIARISDRSLLERMRVIAAEGYGRIGNRAEGASLLATVFADNPNTSLEIVADVHRVAGRLAAPEDPAAARRYFGHAARIFEGIGYLTGLANVQSDVLEMLHSNTTGTDQPVVNQSHPTVSHVEQFAASRKGFETIAAATERVSVLVETASHPPLLAREALALLADSNTTLMARIIASQVGQEPRVIEEYSATESRIGAPREEIRIPVGTHRDKQFELVVIPEPSAAARATVAGHRATCS